MQTNIADVMSHVLSKWQAATISKAPFSHLIIDDIFPRTFYAEMLRQLPDESAYVPLVDTGIVGKGYSRSRLTLRPTEASMASLSSAQRTFWDTLFRAMLDASFASAVVAKFGEDIAGRFRAEGKPAGDGLSVVSSAHLSRDREGYSLGPHSDAPFRVVSLLFYLPRTDEQADLGTSLYVPKDRAFRCPGGPHHKHDKFDRVATAPYLPNSLLAFPKTDVSFHGVEPVEREVTRDILFYNLQT